MGVDVVLVGRLAEREAKADPGDALARRGQS